MEYTRNDGTVIQLTKYTSKVAKLNEDAENAEGMESYKKAYLFLREAVPKEELENILDGKTFETVDLQEVNLLYGKIVDAYRKKVDEYQEEKANEVLSKFDGISKALETVGNAQQFKK